MRDFSSTPVPSQNKYMLESITENRDFFSIIYFWKIIKACLILIIFHEIASILKSVILQLAFTNKPSFSSVFDPKINKYSIVTYIFTTNKHKQHKTTTTTTTLNRASIAYTFIAHVVYYLFVVIGGAISLIVLGISPLNILAIFGSLGFALALGLQGLLSDISASLVISLEGNFQLNDIIEVDKNIGKVINVTLFRTTILDLSNRHVHIPNSNINKSIFRNYTAENYTIANFSIAISNYYLNNGKTIDEIIKVIYEAVLSTPETDVIEKSLEVGISNMNDIGTGFSVRALYKSTQFPDGETRIKTNIRKALQENDIWPIDRKYPQQSNPLLEQNEIKIQKENNVKYEFPTYYATSKDNPFVMKMTK